MDPVWLIAASSAVGGCHDSGMCFVRFNPSETSMSLKQELTTDRAEIDRADQVLVGDGDAEELAVELGLPEG